MKLTLRSFLSLSTAVIALAAWTVPSSTLAADDKASIDGTWTWTVQGRNGGPERKSTLKVKAEGEKLVGKVSAPGRGGETMETEITEGKIKGEDVEFKVVREFNGNKFVMAYKGKLAGDSIKGKREFERQGEKQSADWEAKREVEKK